MLKKPLWIPIASAPKDGSEVLLRYGDAHGLGCYENGKWLIFSNGDYMEGGYGKDFQVTPSHWFPVPADICTEGGLDGIRYSIVRAAASIGKEMT